MQYVEGCTYSVDIQAKIKPVVDVIKLFWGNLDFPKINIGKKFVTMSEPALKCENNAIFKQNYTKNCLFLLKDPILAVLAWGEI